MKSKNKITRRTLLEEHYLSLSLDKRVSKPKDIDWRKTLARDLKEPRFKINTLDSISRRLKRIYIWIITLVYTSWIIKLIIHPKITSSIYEIISRSKAGIIPGTLVFTAINTFMMMILIIITLLEVKKIPIGKRKAKGEIKEQKEEISDRWKKE